MAEKAWRLVWAHRVIVATVAMACAVAVGLVVVMEFFEGGAAAGCLTCRPVTSPPDETLKYLGLLFLVMFCVFAFAAFIVSTVPRDTVD